MNRSLEIKGEKGRKEIAEDAKELLLYVSSAATSECEMREFYRSLDVDRIVAFIEIEGKNLLILPKEYRKVKPERIIDQLLKDYREQVETRGSVDPDGPRPIDRSPIKDALRTYLPDILSMNFSAKDWEREIDEGSREIIETGRRCVERLLKKANKERRDLRPEEIKGVKNMACLIPDEKVIVACFPFAIRYPEIAVELLFNEKITKDMVNKLTAIALGKFKSRPKEWEMVLIELIAQHYFSLNESNQSKLRAISDSRMSELIKIAEGNKLISSTSSVSSGEKNKTDQPSDHHA